MAGLLGAVRERYRLVNLADSGEVVPLLPLTDVPLTKPWFVGMANIRGSLYSVTDFSAFQARKLHHRECILPIVVDRDALRKQCGVVGEPHAGACATGDDPTSAAPDEDAPEWAAQVFTD